MSKDRNDRLMLRPVDVARVDRRAVLRAEHQVVRGPVITRPRPLRELADAVMPERLGGDLRQRQGAVGPFGLQLVQDQAAGNPLDPLRHPQSSSVQVHHRPGETEQLGAS
jgi:hypothetical protein